MMLELSKQEADFLKTQLAHHVARVEDALVHTDKHELQHLLAQDLEKLMAITERLARLVATSEGEGKGVSP